MSERENIIAQAKSAAAALGKSSLSRSEFIQHSGISNNQIYRHFDGWREVCELAGLEPHVQNVRLDNDEIFSAMRDAFIRIGSIVTKTKIDRHYRYSMDVFKKRGLNWTATLIEFRKWVEKNDPTFPCLAQLPTQQFEPPAESEPHVARRATTVPAWHARNSRLFGDFLNFRGLQHAPVNEQGVVFLFGMVAHELGYVVEMVTTGFPGCEAKRRVSGGRWERVRIEFEFQSRNFRDHGHAPAGCDVVVCWEHNWPECPNEVLELKEAIRALPAHSGQP